MRTKPPYTECKIFIDGGAPRVGDFIRTDGGSAYMVQHVRVQERIILGHYPTRRFHLRCLRWPVENIPPDARVITLRWYKRAKRKPVSGSRLHSPTR